MSSKRVGKFNFLMSDIFVSIYKLLLIQANFNHSYLGPGAVWTNTSKKFYNQVGYEESFEFG
jgi:hypothetical protein